MFSSFGQQHSATINRINNGEEYRQQPTQVKHLALMRGQSNFEKAQDEPLCEGKGVFAAPRRRRENIANPSCMKTASFQAQVPQFFQMQLLDQTQCLQSQPQENPVTDRAKLVQSCCRLGDTPQRPQHQLKADHDFAMFRDRNRKKARRQMAKMSRQNGHSDSLVQLNSNQASKLFVPIKSTTRSVLEVSLPMPGLQAPITSPILPQKVAKKAGSFQSPVTAAKKNLDYLSDAEQEKDSDLENRGDKSEEEDYPDVVCELVENLVPDSFLTPCREDSRRREECSQSSEKNPYSLMAFKEGDDDGFFVSDEKNEEPVFDVRPKLKPAHEEVKLDLKTIRQLSFGTGTTDNSSPAVVDHKRNFFPPGTTCAKAVKKVSEAFLTRGLQSFTMGQESRESSTSTQQLILPRISSNRGSMCNLQRRRELHIKPNLR